MALEDVWNNMTEEQKIQATSCKTPEELLALAEEQGYRLSDEQLEAIAGGSVCDWFSCTNDACGRLGS